MTRVRRHGRGHRAADHDSRHRTRSVPRLGPTGGRWGVLHAGKHRSGRLRQLRDDPDLGRCRRGKHPNPVDDLDPAQPVPGNGTLLAKELATIDQISAGRLTVGLAVGNREDDFTATATDYKGRGAAQDALLTELKAVWAGESRGVAGAVGPAPVQPGGPPLLIGGTGPAAMRRTVEFGAGWIGGGGEWSASRASSKRSARVWAEAGREGRPRFNALAYFSLGPDAVVASRRYLLDYYGFLGETTGYVAAGALTTEDAVRTEVGRFAAAGCDELILFPCSPDLAQVDLLAAAALSAH